MGLDRLGDPGRLRRRACRPEPAHNSITGEGSHQLTANDIGAMGRFGANVIVFVLNNSGYLIERALEENPNWTYNDLAPWNYAEVPKALCSPPTRSFTARVDHAGRTGRSDEIGPRQQIRRLYRNHGRQDGYAAGSSPSPMAS